MLTALPRGRQVTEPSDGPEFQKPLFGFVENAERFNSRASMIGIVAIVLVEAIAGRGLLEVLGFEVGNGLGFEL